MKRYIKSFVSLCLVLLLALAALPMQANAVTDPFFVVGYTTQSYIEKDDSVTVTVTLECGYETVYAEDGEKKTASSGTSVSGKYATVGSGSSEQPIKTVTRAPVIAGIGVVCRGGGNELTRAELTALLSAAFGVGTNKIYISESN